MNRNILCAVALSVTTVLSYAQEVQTKLIEKVERKGAEILIPYEKYQLSNGLIVIVHEDHSDPIVHVDVTYHVGSAREQEGRSGFAHFFEHMMFQGSDNVADEEHFKIVTEAGGQMNGTTNADRTNYFETLPSNYLELGLWLEADRMGFLLDAVTQQKFEVQRSTVKNERGQNYDNRPYGLTREKSAAAMYPQGHAYSWPTIGFLEDLDRVNVNDLKKFFLRWYGPNNAVLTVAGDVNSKEVVKLAEKYFGSIPRGPEVKTQDKTPVKLDGNRYISHEDNVRFPLLQFSFPTVPGRHPDEPALDVLSDILGGGKNSIFYQNFVKSQFAIQARVGHPCQELSGEFQINILLFPDKSLAKADSMIKSCFEEFEKRGVKKQDLKKYKAQYQSHLFNSLSSVNGKAAILASNQTFAGNPNYIKKDFERYMKVTKKDVMRVYNTYVKDKPAVILTVYPKGKSDIVAHKDNFIPPARNINAPESEDYKNLAYTKAKDNFDRSKKPMPGPASLVKVPDIWKETFANGLQLIGTKSNEVPSVTLQLSLEAGHRYEPKEKSGLAQITADLLNESTLKHSAEEISAELEKIGSSIDVSAGTQEITITISSLIKNLDATLKIAEEILFQPRFDAQEFERSRNQQLESIANQSTQPVAIANNVYNKLLFGNDHVMGTPVLGTSNTVNSITLEDVKEYYKANFSPSIATLVIVGDVDKSVILPKLTFIKNWADKKVIRMPEPAPPVTEKTRIYLVDKTKAAQSEIRIGYLSMPYDATGEYFKSIIMNYPLGMSFNSRINLNLREDKGYTYGARSHFNGTKFNGPFTAQAGVRINATDSSIIEFMKEIKNYVDGGIKPEELDFTKNSIGQSEALRYESPSQKAYFLKRMLDYKLEKNYVAIQSEILKNITAEEVNKLAKKHLPYDKMNILVVGDKAVIYEGLSKLGYEIIELDMEGKPISGINTGEVPKK